MKRSKLAKKGLALVLTAAMCAQPLMVSAEEFSFQSELEDAVVTEAEPEQVEESGEAEGFEDADGFLSDDSLDEADGMTGDAAGEEEAEADGETDEFVASMDGSATGLDIDESAATVIEGTVDNAEGLTWRLDVNGVFYLDGEGELASYPRYKIEGAEADFSNYSINSLVIGSKISGTLDEDCFGAYVCQNVQNLIIKDRATGVKMELAQHGFEDRMRNLQNIVIGNGIVSLPDSTFCGCRALKNVIIPDSVETIGNSVFYGCTSLEEVIIPDSVKTCGTYIFMGCTSLKRVTLSKNVSVLSDGMFDNCVELEEVIIPDNVEEYGIDADGNGCYIFYGCKALKKVVLSKNAKIIPAGMFNGCISLKDITIPEGITAIEGGAFYNISSEANLFIPDSVTAIGYATRLPQCKVTMPCRFALENGLYRREGYSFYHMNGENDYDEDNCTVCRRTGKCGTDASYILTLGGKMTVSGTGTVSDIDYEIKEEIKTVIIEEGIYYVDDFSHCTNLESIKLADSVKILQSLQECFKLTTIITGKNLEEDIITVNCPKMENVVVSSENPNYVNKNGVVFSKDETRLVYYPSNLPGEEYIIPDTVKEISNFAFWYNQNLKKIVVPESVAALDWDGGSGYFILGNSKKLEKIILNNAAINIPLDFCYEVETLNCPAAHCGRC